MRERTIIKNYLFQIFRYFSQENTNLSVEVLGDTIPAKNEQDMNFSTFFSTPKDPDSLWKCWIHSNADGSAYNE
jgi:hypothetical protein